ncbi:acyloxyacyl hydrolase [Leeuwenhoekiella palythoae]|uniref:acyloxyacyl hydrolase n=1 Tax=Leeuwenhoekiella palythoae TaxID=573501 RepID=UPI00351924FE
MWRFFTLVLLINLAFKGNAQENVQGHFYQIGFNFGYASVDNIFFKDDDYYYEVYLHKIQILYRIKSGKLDYDFIFQPEINKAYHKLYNPWFAGHPDIFSEYRTQLMTLKTINEYIFNCGVILRTSLTENLNIYGLASLGPGYFDVDSERMAKGIGFSDNLALGLNYKFLNVLVLDLRLGFRHVSNAEIKQPIEGYDALEFNLGLAYKL